jgi:hypothetical protein
MNFLQNLKKQTFLLGVSSLTVLFFKSKNSLKDFFITNMPINYENLLLIYRSPLEERVLTVKPASVSAHGSYFRFDVVECNVIITFRAKFYEETVFGYLPLVYSLTRLVTLNSQYLLLERLLALRVIVAYGMLPCNTPLLSYQSPPPQYLNSPNC